MKTKSLSLSTILILLSQISLAEKIHFNPDQPIYLEYHTQNKVKNSDLSLQIDDADSAAKVRVGLENKATMASSLDHETSYIGYFWLQIGKNKAENIVLRRTKQSELLGWLTNQDGVQALFLFDNESALNNFKLKTHSSKKPLTDKNSLPVLIKPTASAATPSSTSNPTMHSPQITNTKNETVDIDVDEAQKYNRMIVFNNQLTTQQKEMNVKKSDNLLGVGLKQYQQKNYSRSTETLNEALNLNPENNLIHYYLAINAYQMKQYKKSLALLSLCEGANYPYAEYHYFLGLNQLKLQKYDKAAESLEIVRDENSSEYSPTASFFIGTIEFQKEDYMKARKSFEYTMDHSKNSKLDKESEAMIEKIDKIEIFNNQSKQKFHYSLFAGFGYDSNVLNISTENTATDTSALRFIYGVNLSYKLLTAYTYDLASEFSLSDYYSLDNKLKSNATIQATDPLQIGITLPFHYRFEFDNRIVTWGLLSSYQTTLMSLEDTSRKKILDSYVIGTDLLFSISENLYSRYFLEYAQDISYLTSTSPSDLSANKFTLSTTLTLVTDAQLQKSWMGDLSYTLNNAKGNENNYTKLNAGITYSQIKLWNALNSLKLDYTNTKYPNNSADRNDSIFGLTASLLKELTKSLSYTISAQYNLSQSNVESYKYNKYLIQNVLTYSGAF